MNKEKKKKILMQLIWRNYYPLVLLSLLIIFTQSMYWLVPDIEISRESYLILIGVLIPIPFAIMAIININFLYLTDYDECDYSEKLNYEKIISELKKEKEILSRECTLLRAKAEKAQKAHVSTSNSDEESKEKNFNPHTQIPTNASEMFKSISQNGLMGE